MHHTVNDIKSPQESRLHQIIEFSEVPKKEVCSTASTNLLLFPYLDNEGNPDPSVFVTLSTFGVVDNFGSRDSDSDSLAMVWNLQKI